MLISTKGRYAIRVMIDLAENCGEGFVSMKSVAERQDISLKYIERILPSLTKAGLIKGVQGKGGGYKLCRPPQDYTISEILKVTEGSFAPVACLVDGAKPCEREGICRTVKMWREVYALLQNYFEGVTLLDLMSEDKADNYVI